MDHPGTWADQASAFYLCASGGFQILESSVTYTKEFLDRDVVAKILKYCAWENTVMLAASEATLFLSDLQTECVCLSLESWALPIHCPPTPQPLAGNFHLGQENWCKNAHQPYQFTSSLIPFSTHCPDQRHPHRSQSLACRVSLLILCKFLLGIKVFLFYNSAETLEGGHEE